LFPILPDRKGCSEKIHPDGRGKTDFAAFLRVWGTVPCRVGRLIRAIPGVDRSILPLVLFQNSSQYNLCLCVSIIDMNNIISTLLIKL
jgi:hypothetical protein